MCRTKKPVNELIRVARIKSSDASTFVVDPIGNANGRGCHVCKNLACIEKCIKTRALNRSFKTNITDDVYNELLKFSKTIEK